MKETEEDLTVRVYEELDAALTDHELNNAERKQVKVQSGNWREGFVRGFMENLRDLQSRLNNYKYQAKVPPEFLVQIEMRPPKNQNLAMICTLEYHKNYQFAEGLKDELKLFTDKPLVTPVKLGDIYAKLLADFPIELSIFDAAINDIGTAGLMSAQFDSVQHRAIYELEKYGGLIAVVFAFFNAEKFPQEISPDFPKIFLWSVYDAQNMGLEIGENGVLGV